MVEFGVSHVLLRFVDTCVRCGLFQSSLWVCDSWKTRWAAIFISLYLSSSHLLFLAIMAWCKTASSERHLNRRFPEIIPVFRKYFVLWKKIYNLLCMAKDSFLSFNESQFPNHIKINILLKYIYKHIKHSFTLWCSNLAVNCCYLSKISFLLEFSESYHRNHLLKNAVKIRSIFITSYRYLILMKLLFHTVIKNVGFH